MTKARLLKSLRELELKLHSPEVQRHVAGLDAESRRRFVAQRIELSRYIGVLTYERQAAIAQQLDALSGDLKEGIAELNDAIADLEDTAAFFAATSKVLGLIARVLALV